MFKRFSAEENISSVSQVKNSAQRGIVASIIESYPNIEPHIENILPKKSFMIGKAQNNIQLVVVNNEILFFSVRDGPFIPTLKLLHQYPSVMPKMQVDRGAVKYVLNGADIMCPGFTSPGGALPVPIEAEKPVAIYAEGKQHAMGVGLTKMSTEQIRTLNKGIAVESYHFLMDELWQMRSL